MLSKLNALVVALETSLNAFFVTLAIADLCCVSVVITLKLQEVNNSYCVVL